MLLFGNHNGISAVQTRLVVDGNGAVESRFESTHTAWKSAPAQEMRLITSSLAKNGIANRGSTISGPDTTVHQRGALCPRTGVLKRNQCRTQN